MKPLIIESKFVFIRVSTFYCIAAVFLPPLQLPTILHISFSKETLQMTNFFIHNLTDLDPRSRLDRDPDIRWRLVIFSLI